MRRTGTISLILALARAATVLKPFSQNTRAVRLLMYCTLASARRSDLAPGVCQFAVSILTRSREKNPPKKQGKPLPSTYRPSDGRRNGPKQQLERPNPSSYKS